MGFGGLKKFSNLGKAARVGEGAELGSVSPVDDTAIERHLPPPARALRGEPQPSDWTAGPVQSFGVSCPPESDIEAGRKRKAEMQSVLSPTCLGKLAPAPAATVVLLKRRASPELPPVRSISTSMPAPPVPDSHVSPTALSSLADMGEHEIVINSGGTHTAPAKVAPAIQDGLSEAGSFQAVVPAAAGRMVLMDGDADDEDDTVMPGNSRLAARVMAGRQSLAPLSHQV